jgi:ribosomal-protein-alanine N-acetyltransferase
VEQSVILETERLLLRPHVMEDAPALDAVLGDAVAMEFYPAALDRRGVEEWIERNIGRYRRDGFGRWAMVLKSTGELIGSCGCVLQDVEERNEVEIGYNVRRDVWGRGYATEAARGCRDYGFKVLQAPRLISMIRPENARSIRVAEKNGMTCAKTIFWRGYDHRIYVLNRMALYGG